CLCMVLDDDLPRLGVFGATGFWSTGLCLFLDLMQVGLVLFISIIDQPMRREGIHKTGKMIYSMINKLIVLETKH
ncbi:hypothetical protein ACJX0J_032706, partial [Zea mays]